MLYQQFYSNLVHDSRISRRNICMDLQLKDPPQATRQHTISVAKIVRKTLFEKFWCLSEGPCKVISMAGLTGLRSARYSIVQSSSLWGFVKEFWSQQEVKQFIVDKITILRRADSLHEVFIVPKWIFQRISIPRFDFGDQKHIREDIQW